MVTPIKALSLLTGCFITIQGRTLAAVGPIRGLEDVQRVADDAMRNVHPVLHIQRLMVLRDLRRDPAMASEDWDRFLPKFRKTKRPGKQKKVKREQRTGGIPAPPRPRKEDIEMETGGFWLKREGKLRKKARKEVDSLRVDGPEVVGERKAMYLESEIPRVQAASARELAEAAASRHVGTG
jgi:ribosomal RNA assembly protein